MFSFSSISREIRETIRREKEYDFDNIDQLNYQEEEIKRGKVDNTR